MVDFFGRVVGNVSGDLMAIALLVGGAVGLGAAAKGVWTVFTWLDAKLAASENFDAVSRAFLEDGWARRWQRIVTAGLGRLDRWFGDPWSYRAAERCLALAFAYPVLAILLGWIAEGPLWLAVPDSPNSRLDRAVAVTAVFLLAAVVGLILWLWIRYREPVADAIVARLLRNDHRSMVVTLVRITVQAAILAVAVTVGGVAGLAAGGMGAAVGVLGAGIGAGASIAIGSGVAGVAVFAGVAGVLGVAVGTAGALGASFAVGSILYSLLPALNAVLDWLSWAVSRLLMRQLFRSDPEVQVRRRRPTPRTSQRSRAGRGSSCMSPSISC